MWCRVCSVLCVQCVQSVLYVQSVVCVVCAECGVCAECCVCAECGVFGVCRVCCKLSVQSGMCFLSPAMDFVLCLLKRCPPPFEGSKKISLPTGPQCCSCSRCWPTLLLYTVCALLCILSLRRAPTQRGTLEQ